MNLVRRLAGYLLVWLAAVAVALFVAFQGVSVVRSQVTYARPSPLTPEEARAARSAPAPSQPDESPPERPPEEAPPTSTSAPQTPTTTTATAPTTATTATSEVSPSPPPSPSTRGPASTTTTSMTPVSPGADASEIRTYQVRGGSTALRFAPSGVEVVWAQPNPGYAVSTEPARDNGVLVVFAGDEGRSEVEAWWAGGPRDDVRESEAPEPEAEPAPDPSRGQAEPDDQNGPP